MPTHLASVCLAKGQPFEIQSRPTPKPGPGELLIAVKSVALNPADGLMRNDGRFIPSYPTVIGFDVSGLVLEVGDNVPTVNGVGDDDNNPDICFQPGVTRVAAYGASVWRGCDPDYGVFQERCLVPWQHAVPLPDDNLSWNEAATLPVAVEVALSAWDALGFPREGEPPASVTTSLTGGTHDKSITRDEALLIWGASSSVGTMGVQSARLMRGDPNSPIAAVYATAGLANQTYVGSLGADRVFDYRGPHVVDAIISAAKEDGLVIRHCYLATGHLAPCQAVLKAFLDHNGGGEGQTATIGSAPIVPPDAAVVDGVEAVWLMPSMDDEGKRLEQFQYWMGTWLRGKLAKGLIKPSPEPKLVGKGLGAINAGLDMVLKGVSCTKLVVEVEEST